MNFAHIIKQPSNGKRFALKAKQRGFTMVELGLALLIIAVLGLAALSAYSSNNTSSQSKALAEDMTTLMAKVKQSYAGNYAAVTNAKLSTGSFFINLATLKDVAGVVGITPGSGTLTVSSGTVAVAGDSVQYVLTNIPDAACLPLTTSLAKNATKLLMGANVVKAVGGVPDFSKNSCAGDANTMTIVYM